MQVLMKFYIDCVATNVHHSPKENVHGSRDGSNKFLFYLIYIFWLRRNLLCDLIVGLVSDGYGSGVFLYTALLRTTSFRYGWTMDLIHHPVSICYRQHITQHNLYFVLFRV